MTVPEAVAPEAETLPKPKPKAEPFFYGGQAVIEGVMMRGKHHYAVAVRLPTTKEIVVDRGELKASIYVNPIWKLPFVRGLALIGEKLHLGMKSLIWSANRNAGGNDIVIGKREITGTSTRRSMHSSPAGCWTFHRSAARARCTHAAGRVSCSS